MLLWIFGKNVKSTVMLFIFEVLCKNVPMLFWLDLQVLDIFYFWLSKILTKFNLLPETLKFKIKFFCYKKYLLTQKKNNTFITLFRIQKVLSLEEVSWHSDTPYRSYLNEYYPSIFYLEIFFNFSCRLTHLTLPNSMFYLYFFWTTDTFL